MDKDKKGKKSKEEKDTLKGKKRQSIVKKLKLKKEKPTMAFENAEKEYKRRRKKYIIEATVLIIFSFIIIFLLCNRTFFKDEYRTSKIAINIPLLMFFESDNGEEITFKTLRKTKYVQEFFDGEMDNLTRYNCGTQDFYYIEESNTAIYKIEVTKNFAIKTVKIKYAHGNADCLCETSLTGEKATNLCSE